jgi:cell division protein ZapE
MTSNVPPVGLYPDGLHRDRILPAIELLNERLDVVQVDGGVDYRRQAMQNISTYLVPWGAAAEGALNSAFERIAEAEDDDPVLNIEGRQIRSRRRAGGVVWFDFAVLCGGPRSQIDYLEIAAQFHTILLSNIPCMSAGRASEARRFTWLIDVLYDRRVKLIASAEAPPEQLYVAGALVSEFARAASRLHEMQSPEYLESARRDVGRH